MKIIIAGIVALALLAGAEFCAFQWLDAVEMSAAQIDGGVK